MTEVPTFFVPAASPENEESVYADLAESAGRSAPAKGKRIYSITFIHDGIEWTATVGEKLKGVRLSSGRSRGKTSERVSDPAVVLAIFQNAPYMVVTNHGLGQDVGSEWVNPFMAGEPESVTYFSTTDET